jgi:hypothetical protein
VSRRPQRSSGAAFGVGIRAAAVALTWLPAQARALELQFDEPSSCATDEIAFRVERALKRPLASVAGPDFRIGMAQSGTSVEGRVEISGAEAGAQRRFSAATCDELIDTLALTIVLAIGGERANEHRAPAQLDVEAPVAPASAASDSTARASIADDPGEASALDEGGAHLAPFASLTLDTGSLPALGVGPTLGADIVWHAAELRLFATLLFPRQGTVDVANGEAAGADVGLMLGGALGCVRLATNAVSLTIAACAGIELGRLSAEGTNVDIARESSSLWLTPRADVIARHSLLAPGLEVELQLAALAPLLRDEFVLRDIGSVHQPATLIGRAGVGIRYGFEH